MNLICNHVDQRFDMFHAHANECAIETMDGGGA